MRYYQLQNLKPTRLVTEDGSRAYDLTAAKPTLRSFRDRTWAASVGETTLDEIATVARCDELKVMLGYRVLN